MLADMLWDSEEGENCCLAHLLFCLIACTRPFSDDVFFGFCVGRKGKCHTRESSSLLMVISTCLRTLIELKRDIQSRCQQ
jgi:hypothetical protein